MLIRDLLPKSHYLLRLKWANEFQTLDGYTQNMFGQIRIKSKYVKLTFKSYLVQSNRDSNVATASQFKTSSLAEKK